VNHVKAMIVKFLIVTVMLLLVLGMFYHIDLGEILTISIVMTLVAYVIGDLWILLRFGNVMATVADFVLAYFITWLLGVAIINENISLLVATLWSSIMIAVGESVFHPYVIGINKNDRKKDDFSSTDVQTEFAKESNIVSLVNREQKGK
jgi:Zn-dependent protease with chaperone function